MAAAPASFTDFKFSPQLQRAIETVGYTTPTPIQAEAIPLALAGHDVLGIAQTGTGKTAAYLLPVLRKLSHAQGEHPRALVLAPTRELVNQIYSVFQQLAQFTDLRGVALVGGKGPKVQLEQLAAGADVLVATPGRLLDIYQRDGVYLRQLQTMVLDEADKMMDMGFMPQIRRVLEIVPSKKRQNLLFSATFPEKVERLSAEFLAFPERVEITPQATTAHTVSQKLYRLPNFKTKLNLLAYWLQHDAAYSRIMVFVRTKLAADNIASYLDRKRLGPAQVIHGNKGQNTRQAAMQRFRAGELRVLVTTDVAARGIDVSGVSHVINFDVPLIYEDYVHRIGRTGRAEAEGEALTFCTEAEAYHVKKIEAIIRQTIPLEDVPAEVPREETPPEEKQAMAREIDRQKRRENPDYQGAFHEKQGQRKKLAPQYAKRRKGRGGSRKR